MEQIILHSVNIVDENTCRICFFQIHQIIHESDAIEEIYSLAWLRGNKEQMCFEFGIDLEEVNLNKEIILDKVDPRLTNNHLLPLNIEMSEKETSGPFEVNFIKSINKVILGSPIHSFLDSFPIILLPKDYIGENFLQINPTIPPHEIFEFEKQVHKDNYESTFITIFTFALILSFKNPFIYLPIWSISAFLVWNYFNKLNKQQNHEYKTKYNNYKKDFDERLKNRNEQIDFQKKLRDIKDSDYSQIEKRIQVLREKNNRFNIKIIESTFNKIGVTENLFFEKLCNFFGENLIHRNIEINGYTPDFIYTDEKNMINVIIEIDEPYILKTGIPIHYDDIDEYRNLFFLKINWGIIRFAEYQVKYESEKCLHTIKNVIDVMYGETKKFRCENQKIKKWSYDEALKMSESLTRENYLNIPKIIKEEKNHQLDSEDLPF